MQYRGQTSIEYLILLAGVMLIVLVAGYGVLSSANVEYNTIRTIEGSNVAPPTTTLRESEVPPSGGTVVTVPSPIRHRPYVDCSISFSSDPPKIGGTATFSFDASDIGNDLERAEVNVYVNGVFVGGDTYTINGGGSYSNTYTQNLDRYGNYYVVVTVYDSQGDWSACGKDFSVGDTIYFSDCNEITYWLSSDVVKNSVRDEKPIFLVQKKDIIAEPLPNGRPRRACIDVESSTSYDYKGYVRVRGNNNTIYIGANRGDFNAHRSVYLKGIRGLIFEGVRLDCATNWKRVSSRKPCVDLENSSAFFKDSSIVDFGTSIPGITYAVPVRLLDSKLYLSNNIWIVDVDDASITSDWRNYANRYSLSNAFFVLGGASDLNIFPNATVSLKAHPDS